MCNCSLNVPNYYTKIVEFETERTTNRIKFFSLWKHPGFLDVESKSFIYNPTAPFKSRLSLLLLLLLFIFSRPNPYSCFSSIYVVGNPIKRRERMFSQYFILKPNIFWLNYHIYSIHTRGVKSIYLHNFLGLVSFSLRNYKIKNKELDPRKQFFETPWKQF